MPTDTSPLAQIPGSTFLTHFGTPLSEGILDCEVLAQAMYTLPDGEWDFTAHLDVRAGEQGTAVLLGAAGLDNPVLREYLLHVEEADERQQFSFSLGSVSGPGLCRVAIGRHWEDPRDTLCHSWLVSTLRLITVTVS